MPVPISAANPDRVPGEIEALANEIKEFIGEELPEKEGYPHFPSLPVGGDFIKVKELNGGMTWAVHGLLINVKSTKAY